MMLSFLITPTSTTRGGRRLCVGERGRAGAVAQRWPTLELMSNDRERVSQLLTLELQARRTNQRRAATHLGLHELDELHELRHGVHSQQREEPVVECGRFFPLSSGGEIK